jgi:hypothetical protein
MTHANRPAAHTIASPTFLILGAAKAGTTALYDILKQHPQVFLPFDKEPMFFSQDENYQRGFDWYIHTYFKGAENYPARGEATPHYLYWAEKTAARIASHIPNRDARLVIILRDPATRAYSWYWNMVKEGKEDLSFFDALKSEPARMKRDYDGLMKNGAMTYGYTRGSDYIPQIKTFYQYFSRDRVFFLKQEDILMLPSKRFSELLGFLGVDAEFHPVVETANPPALPRSQQWHKLLHERSAIKDTVKRWLPRKFRYQLKTWLRDANLVSYSYPPMNDEAREFLQEIFSSQIAELEQLTGLDLADWKKGKNSTTVQMSGLN